MPAFLTGKGIFPRQIFILSQTERFIEDYLKMIIYELGIIVMGV